MNWYRSDAMQAVKTADEKRVDDGMDTHEPARPLHAINAPAKTFPFLFSRLGNSSAFSSIFSLFFYPAPPRFIHVERRSFPPLRRSCCSSSIRLWRVKKKSRHVNYYSFYPNNSSFIEVTLLFELLIIKFNLESSVWIFESWRMSES